MLSESEHGHDGVALPSFLPFSDDLGVARLVLSQDCGRDDPEIHHEEDHISALFQEIRSHAPTPTIDITVAFG